jgi:Integral membrane protein TerC family
VDNVVALVAVARGSIFILAVGLLMCVPLLMYGSLFATALFRRYPLLKRGGGALLGWLAGDIAMSDPLIADWVDQQSPALTVVVPILVVVFVLIESRIMENALATAQALRPKLEPNPVIIHARPTVIEQAPAVAVTAVERGGTLPSHDASATRAPRAKRIQPWVWIVTATTTVVVLWIFFKFLSLDFASTTPPVQWTPPTGPR